METFYFHVSNLRQVNLQFNTQLALNTLQIIVTKLANIMLVKPNATQNPEWRLCQGQVRHC